MLSNNFIIPGPICCLVLGNRKWGSLFSCGGAFRNFLMTAFFVRQNSNKKYWRHQTITILETSVKNTILLLIFIEANMDLGRIRCSEASKILEWGCHSNNCYCSYRHLKFIYLWYFPVLIFINIFRLISVIKKNPDIVYFDISFLVDM